MPIQSLCPPRDGLPCNADPTDRKVNGGISYRDFKSLALSSLVKAGKQKDVFVKRRQQAASGTVRRSRSNLTYVNTLTGEVSTHPELKSRWSTPWGDKALRKRVRKNLLHYCHSHRRVYTGEASFEIPCGLPDVRRVWDAAQTKVRKHFEYLRRRGHAVKLVFTIVEHTTRIDGALRLGPDGKLRYHIHVHFLIIAEDRQDLTRASWVKAFKKKFKGGIQRIHSKKRLVHYLLKPLEIVDLVDAGEYPEWFEAVKGLSRLTLYKPLRACIEARTKQSRKVFVNSAGQPFVMGVPRPLRVIRERRSSGASVVPLNAYVRSIRKRHIEGYDYEHRIYRNVRRESDVLPRAPAFMFAGDAAL